MPFIGNKPSAVPLTSADIADSIITSAKIVDGTIANADINSSAAITYSKLSLGTSIVNADISASAAIASTKLSGVNDAKVWVNFNGTGTVAIRGSFNVTSITDNGTGDYVVNFTNSLADTNYVVATCMNCNTDSATADHRFVLYIQGTGTAYSMNTNNLSVEVSRVELNGQQRDDAEMVALAIFR
jgi:hypothetical protein